MMMAFALGAQGTQPAPPAFNDAERSAIVAYWGTAGRYRAEAPGLPNGGWVVRLTVEGSTWLWGYNRARGAAKAPPTDTAPQGTSNRGDEWEKWVQAKLAYDRAAAQAAIDSAAGKPAGVLPAPPGSIPADLLSAAGNPPVFAAPVAPLRHTVTFDDGTSISYTDHVGVPARYAYYRFPQGVMFGGTAVKDLPPSSLDPLFDAAGMTPFEQHVVKAVSRLEGGFESVNTYDTGFVSVGFVQFACLREGGGSLGEALTREKKDRPDDFQADFRRYGIDVSPAGLLVAVDPATGAELTGPAAAQKIIDDKRLIAVFQRAGAKSQAFRIAQVLTVKDHYYPADDPISVTVDGRTVTGKVSDVIHSEAGMATLFDRKINRGSTDPFGEVLAGVMAKYQLTALGDAAAHEREIVQAIKYRVDFLADTSLSQPPVQAAVPPANP